MKKLLITLATIFCTLTLYAQSGAHSPSENVKFVFISNDGKRCLTLSPNEAVMWDLQTKKPILVKNSTELEEIKFVAGVDPKLNYLIGGTPEKGSSLIDLSKMQVLQPWQYGETKFLANGNIIGKKAVEGKNTYTLYLFAPKTKTETLISDEFSQFSIENLLVKITQYTRTQNIVRYYNTVDRKFLTDGEVPAPTPYHFPLRQHYFEIVPIQKGFTKQNHVRYKYNATVQTFPLNNPSDYAGTPQIINYNEKNGTINVLEHNMGPSGSWHHLSFLNTYNYNTGELLNSLELTSSSPQLLAVAKAKFNKREAAAKEQNRINNLPENQLKQRVGAISINGSYVINQQTLRIFKFQPDKPVYQGNMVSLEAILSGGNRQAFESLTNLENKAMYKSIKGWKVCPYCSGKGITQTEHVKEIDQTLSRGRIITQTTTYTKGCQSCGGGGVIPN